MRHTICSILFFVLIVFKSSAAADSPDMYVPPALEPWTKWVLERTPELACPTFQAERNCLWPGRLELKAGSDGATFRYLVTVDRRDVVGLPGDQTIWPIDVQISSGKNGTGVEVDAAGLPALRVPAGSYEITGRFSWQQIPKSIRIPAEVGLVQLSVNGSAIDRPKVAAGGELWLQQENVVEATEQNSLRVEVNRMLTDGLPFEITSQFRLRIAGKPREIAIPHVLLDGSTLLRIDSPLSYKFDERGVLTLQGRPGSYVVTLYTVLEAPPEKLQAPKVELKGWAENEYWVWQGREALRSVEISGAPAIEPERTTLPDDWRRLPAYSMNSETTLVLTETRRGENEVLPNQIALRRHIWLDMDRQGYSVQDTLTGTVNRDWRLNMRPGLQLGRAVISGHDQLITQDEQSKLPGLEIRQQQLSLQAELRGEGSPSNISAIGWDNDVTSLSWQLSVPPGWKLIHAVGPDVTSGSWFSWWRLWDFFFICLFAVAAGKLLDAKWGIAAFVLMVLCHGEVGAPRYAWINLLAVLALLRVIPPGTFHRMLRYYFSASAVFIGLIALPFIVLQLRNGMFPQLAQLSSPYRIDPDTLAGVGMGLIGLSLFVGFIVLVAKRLWAKAFLMLILGPIALMLIGGLLFGLGGRSADRYDYASAPAAYEPQAIPAPAPRQKSFAAMEQQEQALEMEAGDAVSDMLSSGGSYGRVEKLKKNYGAAKQALVQNDPNAVVQTGAGIPNWNWRDYYLSWNGPVDKNRQVTLYLFGPTLNFGITLLRILLLVAFFLAAVRLRGRIPLSQTSALLLFGALSLLHPSSALAQSYPSEEMLTELQNRLTENICKENCLVPSLLRFELQCRPGDAADELRISAVVHGNGASSWPIPGPFEQFLPTSVSLDQSSTDALRRDASGIVWVRVPTGTHRIEVKGKLRAMDAVTLQFGIRPRHVEVCANNFSVDGLSPTGSVEDSIQFVRSLDSRAKATTAARDGQESEAALGDWFIVRREITVGLPWTAFTTVTRLGSTERAQLIKVPTFTGESVEDARFKVEGGNIMVTFARGERVVEWTSGLHEEPELEFQALRGQPLTEVWRLRCSSIWRCDGSGFSPTTSSEEGEQLTEWNPWPGDKLKISVRRPLGVPGQVETIDNVGLNWVPGLGLMSANLEIHLRSGQAGSRKITLPPEASVQEVLINDAKRNLLPEKGVLTLPVVPGSQNYKVRWQQPWNGGVVARMPVVDIGGPSTNAVVSINMPQDRWLLWVRGPGWGPAVLFWGAFLVMIGMAVVASKLKIAPLSTAEWLFLGLGLTVHHPLLLLLPAAWFYANERRRSFETSSRWKFNLTQILLVCFSLLVFAVLLASIYAGLIVSPDVGVRGNESSNYLLRWYVDRQGSVLPTPMYFSLPLWTFKILMLVWSSWLVFALLRWLRWGWSCFSTGGLWRSK